MRGISSSTETVVLDRGNSTTCTVNLHGATIVSWRVFNVEQLFVSSETRYDNLTPIRGGVSFLYTQFGFDNIFIPNNGFARTCHWTIEQRPRVIRDGDVKAVFSLTSDPTILENFWNFEFILKYVIVLKERSLSLTINIYNGDEETDVKFNMGFMNYIKLNRTDFCQVFGLKGLQFVNKITLKVLTQKCESVKIDRWIDRIYLNAMNKVQLKRTIAPFWMQISRSRLPEVGIWNPWSDMVQHVSHLHESEVNEMVVITSGYLLTHCVVPAKSWTSSNQTLQCVLEELYSPTFHLY